jgi:hypothetical protein
MQLIRESPMPPPCSVEAVGLAQNRMNQAVVQYGHDGFTIQAVLDVVNQWAGASYMPGYNGAGWVVDSMLVHDMS